MLPLLLAACVAPASRGGADLPPELGRVLRDYEAAWQAHDAGGLAAFFSENGRVLSSGRPPIRGRAPIGQDYASSGGPLAPSCAADGRWFILSDVDNGNSRP